MKQPEIIEIPVKVLTFEQMIAHRENDLKKLQQNIFRLNEVVVTELAQIKLEDTRIQVECPLLEQLSLFPI